MTLKLFEDMFRIKKSYPIGLLSNSDSSKMFISNYKAKFHSHQNYSPLRVRDVIIPTMSDNRDGPPICFRQHVASLATVSSHLPGLRGAWRRPGQAAPLCRSVGELSLPDGVLRMACWRYISHRWLPRSPPLQVPHSIVP